MPPKKVVPAPEPPIDDEVKLSRVQRALADQETGFVSSTSRRVLTDDEKRKMEDFIHNYPFMDDLITILKDLRRLNVDRDPAIKDFLKEFHDGARKRLIFRKIAGYPYEVEIVKETDDCPKLWRRITNEFVKVRNIKDFRGIDEDLYEPLPVRRVGLVRFMLTDPLLEKDQAFMKKTTAEIIKIVTEVFPQSAKFVYKVGRDEIYCAFMDINVVDDGKIGDFVTAKIYEQYYRLKEELDKKKKLAWERRDIATERIRRFEAEGKNKKDHASLFLPFIAVQNEIDENQRNLELAWNIVPLERGPTLARVVIPFSKSVTEILLGKEILANYNGFGGI